MGKDRFLQLYFLIYSFVQLTLFVNVSHSQNIVFTNPADIYEPKSSFVNPALISYQGSQVVIGMKAFHVGFLESNTFGFKNGFLSVASPYLVKGKIGLGFNCQYFNTPLYRQSNFSAAASRKFWELFSFAIRLNLFTKSYNRNEFDLLNEDDPVFSNGSTKYAFSFGTGVMLVPLSNFYIAAGIEHINRPNVALSSQPIYQPMEVTFGLKYTFSSTSSSFYLKNLNSRTNLFFEIERSFLDDWNVRLCYGMKSMRISGLVKAGSGISLSYGYEYPLSKLWGTSFGSYSLCLIYNIDKVPQLPAQIKRPCKQLFFETPRNTMKVQPRFEVYSSVSALEILEKQIVRVFDDSLTKEEIASLTNFELGTLDSNKTNSPLYFKTRALDAFYPNIKRVGKFTELYKTALDSIIRQLENNKGMKVDIVSTNGVTNRAAGLQNYIMKTSGVSQNQVNVVAPIYKNMIDSVRKKQKISRLSITPKESLTVISHESTRFYIVPIYINSYDKKWALSIRNSSGALINEFSGIGNVPEEISWNWSDENGQFIEPDLYYYSLQWVNEQGQTQRSNPRIIDVQKLKRNLKITITRQKKNARDDIKKYGIKLNR